MLRNLLDEVMRRRLWPIAVAALLVMVAAPLLFLKSASPGAPASAAAPPAAAPEGELPARAQRLLATSDGAQKGGARNARRRAGDPFQPPSGYAAKSADEAQAPAKEKGAAAAAANEPVPVVITNADGTSPVTPGTAAPGTSSATAPGGPIGDDAKTANADKRQIAVNVRFGQSLPGRLHRRIPRLQTFVAGGRVIAIFVKYSPRRKKAVFAIAPSTLVTGEVECRRKSDLCRYVDIPAGKHVRLTTLSSNGSLVTRRLDVVRIGGSPRAGATAVAAARSAPANGSCLLARLLTLDAKDSPLAATACKS